MKKRVKVVRVNGESSADEMIKKGLRRFVTLVRSYKEEDDEINEDVIVGFVAGFESGLNAVGIPDTHSIQMAEILSDTIIKAVDGGCGECEACLAINNKK